MKSRNILLCLSFLIVIAICTMAFQLFNYKSLDSQFIHNQLKEISTKSISYPEKISNPNKSLINPNGSTLQERIMVPEGFKRETNSSNSFEEYLRTFPMKNADVKVHYFNGEIKNKPEVYCAVLDIDCGTKDLQQCADAVMRLRGEYLYSQKRYAEIHFNFLKDQAPHYFLEYSKNKTDYPIFRKYMDYVFNYANTSSLHNELPSQKIENLKGGDVFIQKGVPYGHAVIVMDVAINDKGEKIFLLAQSYMPAQDLQLLNNPNDDNLSPWYKLQPEKESIRTPEWNFTKNDLKTFN